MHPYYDDLSYAANAMKRALAAMTKFNNNPSLGCCNIILIQGNQGSGKTAFLHEVLKRFQRQDSNTVNHYNVISTWSEMSFETSVAGETANALKAAITQNHSTVIAIDDGEWLLDKLLLPAFGSGSVQDNRSIPTNLWNQIQDKQKTQSILLIISS